MQLAVLKAAGRIKMKTVLVVAAHPDDEVLGIGGTAARHAAEGDFVYALILGGRTDIARRTSGRC